LSEAKNASLSSIGAACAAKGDNSAKAMMPVRVEHRARAPADAATDVRTLWIVVMA
jgi:hypothetical protein